MTAMEGLESFFANSKQLDLLLMSFVFGLPLGIVYDVFRGIRMTFPHGKIAVLIEDLLFFFIYGVFMMTFTVTAAGSQFRFFYPVCNALGFIVYYVTLGNLVNKLLRRIISGVGKGVKATVKKLASICGKLSEKFSTTLQIGDLDKKNHDKHLIDDSDLLYNSNTDIEKQ